MVVLVEGCTVIAGKVSTTNTAKLVVSAGVQVPLMIHLYIVPLIVLGTLVRLRVFVVAVL
jgi:hypothetical protein